MADVIAVPLASDWECDLDLTAIDQATRALAGLPGETLVFFFAASPAGAAIDAALSIVLTDLGEGRYYGFVPGVSMSAHLVDYVGQQVYPRLTAGSARLDGVFADARYLVTQTAELVS